MLFPGGEVRLPQELLASGKSGPRQIAAPEQPVPLTRMSDRALFQLADELATLLETESRDDADSRLVDYIDLLVTQVEQELLARMF